MTKQEAYDYFYEGLSDEEKAAGPEALPDFVKHLPKEPFLPSGKAGREWAKRVAARVERQYLERNKEEAKEK